MTGQAAIAGAVLLAALMHASWNAVVKSESDRTVALAMVLLVGSLIGVGVAIALPLPAPAAWPWLLGSGATHGVYYLCLLRAYRSGDLGRVYPIARGTAPVLVALVAGPIAGEAVGAADVGGAGLVSLGVLSLAFAERTRSDDDGARLAARRSVMWALATGVTISIYTVLDGGGARRAEASLAYAAWSFVIQLPWIAVMLAIAGPARIRAYFAGASWKRGLAGGLVATGAWTIAIWAMTVVPIPHVAALRETSVIFAAAIGARMLHEPFGARRIAAAALVATGVAVMHLLG